MEPELMDFTKPLTKEEEDAQLADYIINYILKEKISDHTLLKNEVDPIAAMEIADRLDMDKLVAAHNAVCAERNKEARKNDQLHRILLRHFRMKKLARAYSPDNPDTIAETFEQYQQELDQLDKIIASLKQCQRECSQKVINIRSEHAEMSEQNAEYIQYQINEIQNTVKVLKSSQTGRLLSEKAFERIVYRMNDVRKRISEVRLQFILTIDEHTQITNHAKRLEDLGEGLRMVDFERLRNETQTLSDKIEESGERLARLRLRCDSDTQILAHMREKEFMLGNQMIVVAEELQLYREEMVECRQIVNSKKKELDGVRKKFGQLSDSSGLLEKPTLLMDYDRVARTIEERSAEVVELKADLRELHERMKETEKLFE